ncbi:MAG: hypothetical protein K8T90_03775 [Planctomycetes bacterium]|nr:hypothetical protein [Planctomycetota bacterium]
MSEATSKTPHAEPTPRPSAGAIAAGQARGLGRADTRGRRRERKRAIRRVLFSGARALVRWLPLPVATAAGHCVGVFAWYAVPWMRRQTLGNLEIAFGREKSEAERRRIGRRCYALAGRAMFAWLVLHRMGPERALRRMVAEPCPEAEAVFQSGKGFIIVAQHSGLFELLGAWSAKHIRVSSVGRDAGGDPGTGMLITMRAEMGVRTIEQGGAREIVRTLKRGDGVGMLADQDIRRVNGAFVPFFGRLAHTPIGPATMAVRLGVPIVCSDAQWRSFTTHAACFPEVLHPRPDLSDDEAILDLTLRCSEAIERAVRRRPEEWFWMHDRWRTSPADHPDAPIWPPEARPSIPPGGAS